jgi:copper resistance protein D
LDDALIWWRAVHFAATIMLAGTVLFFALVAEPAFANAGKDARPPARVGFLLRWLAWISLAVVVVSGLAWLIVLAQHLSDGTVTAVLWDGIVWIVLTKTGFGATWAARFALVVVISACLPITSQRPDALRRWAAAFAAACLVGALGFAGHAGAGDGITGLVHLAADVAHLVTAAAWLGALVPLALLLHAAGQSPDQSSMAVARRATQRFSTLGIASVTTLIVTGIVNTWVLAGSVSALLDTDYGRLVLAKVALFVVMVATAAVNRLVLTPRLLQEFDLKVGWAAMRRLCNNSLIETAIGAIILVIVAVLGTLPPGLHDEVAVTPAAAL